MGVHTIEEGSKRLHPSVTSHLSTELDVLKALIDRSRFQHRSQPFLQRMREVLRLGTRVQGLLPTANTSEDSTKPMQDIRYVMIKFVHAIFKATVSTQQIIQLEHFLPTQISIMAVYGRLFALGTSIATYHSLDLEQVLAGESRVEKAKQTKSTAGDLDIDMGEILREVKMDIDTDVERPSEIFDMGQRIERAVMLEREAEPVSAQAVFEPESPVSKAASSASGSSPPAASSPDEPIQEYIPPPSSKKKRIESHFSLTDNVKPEIKKSSKKRTASEPKTKTKKKKRDDMDSIFGF